MLTPGRSKGREGLAIALALMVVLWVATVITYVVLR